MIHAIRKGSCDWWLAFALTVLKWIFGVAVFAALVLEFVILGLGYF